MCMEENVRKGEEEREMAENIKIGEVIRELRKEKGISQETLAGVCGVSMQAVSKWENEQSYPDITFLPRLADFFSVSVDYLLLGKAEKTGERKEREAAEDFLEVPADWEADVLYIAQCRNGVVLSEEEWEKDKVISIVFGEEFKEIKSELKVSVAGDANIDSKVPIGTVSAGAGVNCGDVGGNATAGAGISCGDVEGNVNGGAGVGCGDVGGNVNAGAAVNCGDVGGYVNAGAAVGCSDVEGNVTAGAGVNCGDVDGNVSAISDIKCGDIDGNAKAGRNITCDSIEGDANAAAIYYK